MKDPKAAASPSSVPTTTKSPKSSTRVWLTLVLAGLLAGAPLLQAGLPGRSRETFRFNTEPADQWKDNIFPLRESEPWDISTDYPYPRVLEYDVTEGTWLRLDVHPTTGDIVFDMLGDLYCLPALEAAAVVRGGERVQARPVLLGVPHDADAHFSPDGRILAYKSDAGHGIENIWVMEWKGCKEADLRAAATTPKLAQALGSKFEDEEMLARGVKETVERKHSRLLREGRLGGDADFSRTLHTMAHRAHSSARDQRDVPMGVRSPLPPFRFHHRFHQVVHLRP
jgi:hypothetical protein